jgi:hypothetical protein
LGWPFSGNGFNDEDYKASSALCGGSNKPSVLSAQTMRLRAPSMAQVDTSVGLKVIPEDVRPFPMPAPSASRSVGLQKEENIKNCDSDS